MLTSFKNQCAVEFIDIFNDNTHKYDKFIINLITVKWTFKINMVT